MELNLNQYALDLQEAIIIFNVQTNFHRPNENEWTVPIQENLTNNEIGFSVI